MDEDKINEMLSRSRYKPTIGQTELFVQKTMAALPAETMPAGRQLPRWFAPALAFSFAALAFSFFPVYQSAEDDGIALLLADAGSAAPAEPQSADDMLGFVLEPL